MLLPALLGYASLKNTKSERIDVVKKAQVPTHHSSNGLAHKLLLH